MTVPILGRATWWECPSCGLQDVTHTPGPHTRMHDCPALHGISAPMVQVDSNAGIRAGTVRHVVNERQDYEGREVGVRHDATGKAIMSVYTERADGSNDAVVFAPTAVARLE